MGLRLIGWAAIAAGLLLAGGCEIFSSTCDEDDDECLGRNVKGAGVGGRCTRTVECAPGLSCDGGACTPRGDAPPGTTCRRTAECGEDLYCSAARVCEAAGEGEAGEVCEDSGDCNKGLRCDLSARGLPLRCAETGDKELGEPCEGSECVAGLTCLALEEEFRCRSPLPLPQEIPSLMSWDGAECPEDDDDAMAYFEVPGSDDADDMDFYRLPFPNDIRRPDGKLDLGDHPTPPDGQIPIAARFIEAGDGELTGFATNPVVYFRFSREYGFEDVTGDTVRIVDITPDSPRYDRSGGIRWKNTAGPISKYICPNWLALRPSIGQPLRPATTYVAYITTGIRDSDGDSFERSPDFEAMLQDATPDDEALAEAHETYAPLRAWIDDTDFDASSLLNAAVFTTLDPEAPIRLLAEAIADRDPPEVTELVECDRGLTSPCESEDDSGEVRGACRNADGGFAELHGRISLPRFQHGTLPFEEQGGELRFDSDGEPEVAQDEEICFALSIPEGDPPDDGWPVLIYAHGTGGSFNGQMGAGGFAEDMADGDVPAATLALDMPMHGERRGDSDLGPELLFFNIINPVAARDNVLQGAADLLSLVAFARRGSIDEDDSPLDDAIAFDPDRIAVMGHSQGATHAAIMLPYAPGVAAGMLSGVGGHLVSSLLNKTEPLPIAQAIGAVLFDLDGEDVAGDSFNPALSLIQNYYEAADPINFGYRVHEEPTDANPNGMHLFMSYGLGDSYSPQETQTAYAKSADLPHVGTALLPLNLDMLDAPARDTVTIGDGMKTVGVHQYQFSRDDADEDGHFVAVRANGPGRADVVAFLQAVMAGETPAIGE